MSENIKNLMGSFAQVGIVVRDLDASVKNYKEILGIEPSLIAERSPTGEGKKYYYGQESDFFQKVALYNLGDMELELLQPFGGKSVLQDFLDEHGEGVHHIAFNTGNFSGASAHFEGKGMSIIQTGPTSRHPKMKWGFFSTNDKLGTTVELFNAAEIAGLEAEENKHK